jgi:hypothetical protein
MLPNFLLCPTAFVSLAGLPALAPWLLAVAFFAKEPLAGAGVTSGVGVDFFDPDFGFLSLTFDLVVAITFVNVFAFLFTAFLGVAFNREGAFVAPFDLGGGLTPALAFLGLGAGLAFLVDDERFGFTGFFGAD